MNIFYINIHILLIILQIIIWLIVIIKNRKHIIKSVNFAFFFSICEMVLNLSCYLIDNYFLIKVLYCLSIISEDVIIFSVLFISGKYTNYSDNKINNYFKLFIIPFVVDCFLLVINVFKDFSYILTKQYINENFYYWSISLKMGMYIHFILVSSIVIYTFYVLIKKIKSEPGFYKQRFLFFAILYMLTILSGFFTYIFDLKIRLTFLLYGLMGYFLFQHNLYKSYDRIKNITIKSIIDNFQIATFWFDDENKLVYKNGKAEKIFTDKLNWNKFQYERFLQKFVNKNYARNLDVVKSEEIFFIDGKEFVFEIIYRKLYEEKRYIGCYLNFADITEETEKAKQNYYLANYDSLTGIYNRDNFFETADEKIRNYPDAKWLMICWNIKGLKIINDLFGVENGDKILQFQAQYLRKNIKNPNVYGHIVDDKFAILIQKKDFQSTLFYEKMLDIIKMSDDKYYNVEFNIGIYESSNVIESSKYMYDKALMAIENIPESSKEIIAIYNESIMKSYLDNRAIINDFNYALSNSQFMLYLQPVFNKNNDVIGAEALTRWNKPGVGIVLPEQFLYFFEKSGLLYKLDMYIWEKVAQKIKYWDTIGFSDLFISINISLSDIYYFDVYDYLCNLVEKYSINPKNIKLGIKEALLINDSEKIKQLLLKFVEKGFDIEIDDFGSRYCSLNILKDIDVKYLRINMISIEEINSYATKKIILQYLISLAKELEINIIGDDVESEEQLNFLIEENVDIFQGFFFSKPLNEKQFEKNYLK